MSYIKIIRKSAEKHPVKATATAPVPVRRYPDNTVIPASLPPSYQISDPNVAPGEIQKHCGNCRNYRAENQFCTGYGAQVRTDYVCASWHAVG